MSLGSLWYDLASCKGDAVKYGKTIAVLLVTALCGLLLSCKNSLSSTDQATPDRNSVVAEKRVPLLDSMGAFNLVSREFNDGRIRLTPYAHNIGLDVRRCCGGNTGLPEGTPGEHCDSGGCMGAKCPSDDLIGVTITLQDAYENYYQLGYCVNRYTGDINAYNDQAFSLTMKGNHSAWGPI